MDMHRSWRDGNLLLDGAEVVGGHSQHKFKATPPGLDDLQAELQILKRQLQAHGDTYFKEELENGNAPYKHPPSGSLPTPSLSPSEVPLPALPPRRKKAARDPQKGESKPEIQKLRRQLAEEREELRRLRALRGAAEEKLTARIKRLEERVKTLLTREQSLEKRRITDVGGWHAELTGLRQRLQSIERRQRRLTVVCSVPDEDYRDAVLARHRKMEMQQSGGEKYPFREASKWQERWAYEERTGLHGGASATAAAVAVSAAEAEYNYSSTRDEFREENELLVADQEALQGCLAELTEELSALKVALGGLEEKVMQ